MSQWTSTDNCITKYTWDEHDNLLSIAENQQTILTYSYEETDQVSQSQITGHPEQQFSYDSAGRLNQIKTVYGTTDLVWNAKNQLTELNRSDGVNIVRNYDDEGRLTSISDNDGLIEAYTYDELGRVVETRSQNDASTMYEYRGDSPVDISKVSTASGTLTTLTDDAGNSTVTLEDADGNPLLTMGYNPDQTLSSIVSPANDHQLHWKYDENGRLIEASDSVAGVSTFEYDQYGRMISETCSDGSVNTWTYDHLGQLTKRTYFGVEEQITYLPEGGQRITSTRDGLTTTLSINSRSLVTSMVEPGGRETKFSYDDKGRILSETSQEETRSYDWGNGPFPLRETISRGDTSSIREYLPNLGKLKSIRHFDGASESFSYSASGQLEEYIDRLGQFYRYEYTETGDFKSISGPAGVTTYQYDEEGNLIKRVSPTRGEETFTYDEENQSFEVMDEDGTVSRFRISENGRLLEKRVNNSEIKRTYDNQERLSSLTDPNGKTTRWEYPDPLAGYVRITPQGNRFQSSFDAETKTVTEETEGLPSLQTTSNTRGLLTEVRHGEALNRSYHYYDEGWLSSVTSPEGSHEYAYDTQGSVASESHPIG